MGPANRFPKIPATDPDPLFGIVNRAAYDNDPRKITVAIGAYRDENGEPFMLPTVRATEKEYGAKLDAHVENKEYDTLAGFPEFRRASAELLLGPQTPHPSTVASCVSLGGTGAIRLGIEFLKLITPPGELTVLVGTPTWPNHHGILRTAGLGDNTRKYSMLKSCGLELDLEAMLKAVDELPAKYSVVILHACAHNPTGTDPSDEQWEIIADKLAAKDVIVLVDCAYQGFTSGDFDKDAFGVRTLASRKIPLMICQSYSKNMGMYGDRLGCLSVLCGTEEEATLAQKLLERKCIRPMYSNPPRRASRIAYAVITEHGDAWRAEVMEMSNRIIHVRGRLLGELTRLETPGNWNHIVTQRGMFAFLGINAKRSAALAARHHVYLPMSGRISLVGLYEGNITRFAESLDEVVRDSSLDD